MKKIQIVFSVYLLFGILAITAGCNVHNSEEKEEQLALIKRTDPEPVTLVSHKGEKKESVLQLEKHIESFDEIYDAAIIRGKKHTLIVYKVKHMERFRMKKIEKELNSMLEKSYSKENFIVSSDYKIFLEAVKLSNKINDPNFSEKKANEELERIIKLKKELT
nr:sporulation protein [uncultured Bacillus sp.]